MKRIFTLVTCITLVASTSVAQNDVAFSASDNWVAYMNVFELPGNGGGYVFGSPWGLADVKSTANVSANTLTLQPNFNTYAANPTDAFWVNQTTGAGNKSMDASTFVEPVGFNGSSLTFHGDVLSYTIDQGYTAKFFVKALDSLNGYADALAGAFVFDLPTSGPFTVTVPGAQLPSGLLIQYGFIIRGANANPLNETSLGSVVIGIDDAGISDLNASNVQVSPNPTSSTINITSDSPIDSYQILNITGQTVLTGSDVTSIDVSSLNAGTYFVRTVSDAGASTTTFIKD